MGDGPRRTTGILLVLTATLFWSTAGLFVRAVDLDVWTIAGWRSFFAGCSLLAIAAVRSRGGVRAEIVGLGGAGWLAALLSGVSMFCYIAALKLTSVANVLTVYATVPFVAAGLAYLLLGETASRRTVVASGVALAGVVVMMGGALGLRDVAGNGLSMLMTVTFGLVLVMMRRHPTMNVALINGIAAMLCAAASAVQGMTVPAGEPMLLLALFGLVTTALAYLMFLTGGRYIPSAEAGLIGLLDVVLGPLWVWLAFGERPSRLAIVGGAVVLGAVAWYVASGLRRPLPRGSRAAGA